MAKKKVKPIETVITEYDEETGEWEIVDEDEADQIMLNSIVRQLMEDSEDTE